MLTAVRRNLALAMTQEVMLCIVSFAGLIACGSVSALLSHLEHRYDSHLAPWTRFRKNQAWVRYLAARERLFLHVRQRRWGDVPGLALETWICRRDFKSFMPLSRIAVWLMRLAGAVSVASLGWNLWKIIDRLITVYFGP